MNDDSEGYGADERPSKSQRKRDMTALQALGAELVALGADQLARVELPERLREAIVEARQIKSFEARRRQLQYIGKLMRDVDAEPIRATLEQWRGSAREATAQQHAVERWRDRLLADDAAVTEFGNAYTGSDLQRIRALIASVRRDRAQNRPPKNYRELFRALRDVVEGEAKDEKGEE